MKLIPALIGGLLGLSIALPAQAIPEVRVTFRRGLNFRECPSLDCRIIQTFPYGSRIGYVEDAGTYFSPSGRTHNWSRVQRRDGTTGYVVTDGIRFTGEEYPYSVYPYVPY